jgi:[ribosomal protein S5]-alanine N-acetyltransferase
MEVNINTERLMIQALTIIDAGFMLQLMNTPTWIQHIGNRQVYDNTAASNYIVNNIINSYYVNGFGLYLVKTKQAKTSIGICGIVKREGLPIPDLGFAMLPNQTGKGYATEASKAIVAHAKDHLGLRELAGITKLDNTASISVLEKVGMSFQKMMRLPQDSTEFALYTMALHKEA